MNAILKEIGLHEWISAAKYPKNMLTPIQWQRLTHSDSLSQYLRQITANTIQFHLRSAEWSHPNLDEYQALDLTTPEPCWVREIDWCYQDHLWCFGRVVIPQNSLENKNQVLTDIGRRSLGDILFSDPMLTRSPFEICRLLPHHAYYQACCKKRTANTTSKELWARRSIFHFNKKPLLVAETFLPDFFNFHHNV